MQISAAVYPMIGAVAAVQKQETSETLASGKPSAPVVTVTLSDTAKTILGGATMALSSATDADSKSVDELLTRSGADIYASAISSLKQYPSDIAAKLDDSTISDAGRRILSDQLDQREFNAYRYIDNSTPEGAIKQYKAMISYYDGLSPNEQNSDRYRGMRDSLVHNINRLEAQTGKPKTDLSVSQDPILMLFDAIKKANFNVSDSDAKTLTEKYKATASGLIGSKDDLNGNVSEISQATERFSAVQSVLDSVRSGNTAGLAKLQNLADDPKSIDSFMSYANSLISRAK